MTFLLSLLAGVALGMFLVLWLDARRRRVEVGRERERERSRARRDADDWFDDWGGG